MFLLIVLGICHAVGVASAARALFTARSPQGAMAWVMGMITFPYVAVPLYWILGRNRFLGYVASRREGDRVVDALAPELDHFRAFPDPRAPDLPGLFPVLERLAELPFTSGNAVTLLIDGQATFEAIFADIDAAQSYVLVQFFIIRDDTIGRALRDRLVAKARAGVAVHLLYDEIGCHTLEAAYLDSLRQAGVRVSAFNTTLGWRNRLQLNFRNHRKIVVVDGRSAFVGGHNVGDEYMGKSQRLGHWRDTHIRCLGPAVSLVQLTFAEDWYWATRETLALDWEMRHAKAGNMPVLVLPTGPADDIESCDLFFLQAITAARHRLWIVSPYFVPDQEITSALQLAALRGVDVRIMLPLHPDHKLVYLASFSYLPDLETLGVKFYRYVNGFLHQKVILVDDVMASVGTANCDNRSFRLNFEITMAVADPEFIRQVEAMLLADFACCQPVSADDYEDRTFVFKTAVMLSRLLSPIL
ncbi:phospholipase D/Transphosphatidylase [Solidesulfovibrio carbinoliphilus subsp. oakridgensis]|uniref:Cardiolipin synthase n=1 Tax=Solidesulfovibrio carbinoliphilus subsp. oakridgensis TaxID=694327 RepID=G7Q8G9_9BACT|nr:cardiolipin synthase [Solidesulfovibrio carbinoliphilus]EHJ48581.1 phospholipase D/Transphosphatidylase [Solidesulfovibrio carbinoliphilus subsp. oakridgensis]